MPATFRATRISPTSRRRAAWIIALTLLLALSACARGGPFSRLSQQRAFATTTPTPARTIPPTYTPASVSEARATAPSLIDLLTPSLTPPTQAASVTATAFATATPDPMLSQVKLVGLSWLEKYRYNLLLSFDFPAPVDPADYRVTLEDKPYRCETLAQYPNRLYCNGQGAKVLTTARVQIYAAGAQQPGFETEVWVPYFQ